MNSRLIIALVLFLGMAGTYASADLSLQANAPAGWVQLNANTWVLPANLSAIGCGTENETSCEPTGFFTITSGGTPVGLAANGEFDMYEVTGALSDQIFWDTAGNIGFYSDPSFWILPPGQTPGWPVAGSCVEGGGGGLCTFYVQLAGGGFAEFIVASDGEVSFDPFHAGYDTSDGIQVNLNTPEPASLALLGSGLIGLAGSIRRKLAR